MTGRAVTIAWALSKVLDTGNLQKTGEENTYSSSLYDMASTDESSSSKDQRFFMDLTLESVEEELAPTRLPVELVRDEHAASRVAAGGTDTGERSLSTV